MKLLSVATFLLFIVFAYLCNSSPANNSTSAQKDEKGSNLVPKVELINHKTNQEVVVKIGGKLFTAYSYSDSLMKPILYPIMTAGGHFVTRGWPIKPRPGENTDHPHQRGMWLNYSDINGYDFWNNSYAIPSEARKRHYGKIKHIKIDHIASGNGEGTLVTRESWVSPYGNELLAEKTTYHFIAKDSVRIIDRITTLAADSTVTFNDNKDGFFGIRYNSHLRLPVQKVETYVDAMGNEIKLAPASNEVTGNYLNSEGIKGYDVWGTRAKWVELYGNIEGEKISLVICDHPRNFDYPSYWMARGYGLFAVNPFGAHDFTDGKLTIDYALPKGQSLTFRYRVIISSGFHLMSDEINNYFHDFANMYYNE